MAKPFAVDPPLLDLPNPFPRPEELLTALKNGTRRGREIFVRLWLTEGTPSAFRDIPAIYEDIRGWLGDRLDVHPKEITLIGSARMGYSLASGSEFGRSFNENSDLDFSIVSPSLFELLVEASNLFSDDFRAGSIVPKNERQRALWPKNIAFAERNILRGFLDSKKIPSLERYSIAQNINQSMWALPEKLKVTAGAPTVRNASARVYRDWQSFIDQVSLNIHIAVPTAQ